MCEYYSDFDHLDEGKMRIYAEEREKEARIEQCKMGGVRSDITNLLNCYCAELFSIGLGARCLEPEEEDSYLSDLIYKYNNGNTGDAELDVAIYDFYVYDSFDYSLNKEGYVEEVSALFHNIDDNHFNAIREECLDSRFVERTESIHRRKPCEDPDSKEYIVSAKCEFTYLFYDIAFSLWNENHDTYLSIVMTVTDMPKLLKYLSIRNK